jgi:hypothetical protein
VTNPAFTRIGVASGATRRGSCSRRLYRASGGVGGLDRCPRTRAGEYCTSEVATLRAAPLWQRRAPRRDPRPHPATLARHGTQTDVATGSDEPRSPTGDRRGLPMELVAENVAAGQTTAEEVVEAGSGSGHCANTWTRPSANGIAAAFDGRAWRNLLDAGFRGAQIGAGAGSRDRFGGFGAGVRSSCAVAHRVRAPPEPALRPCPPASHPMYGPHCAPGPVSQCSNAAGGDGIQRSRDRGRVASGPRGME